MKNKLEILFVFFVLVIFTIVFAKYYYPDLYSDSVKGSQNSIRMDLEYFKYKLTFFKDKKINLADVNANENAKSIPVLNYHGIADDPYKNDIVTDNFEDQMIALKQAGYNTITLDDFYAFMHNEKQLPARSVLITFDDGIKSSYFKADPLLKALDYNAVMFIISKQSIGSGTRYYLSKDEVDDMVKSGRWEIESHARDSHDYITTDISGRKGHFMSDKIWLSDESRLESDDEYRKRVHDEFVGAKAELESNFNVKVNAFAFPFGDFGQISINNPVSKDFVLKDALSVYSDGIFYQVWPNKGASYNYPDPAERSFKRITVLSSWSGKDLVDILKNGFNKDLPFRDDFTYNKGWTIVAGQDVIGKNNFALKSLNESNTTMAFLDGSYNFKDYSYNVKIEPFDSGSVSVIARFKDDENYVSCDFALGSVKIRESVNGNSTLLSDQKFILSDSTHLLGITVNKGNISCSVDNNKVTSADGISESLANGGVGIKRWSNIDSSLTIKEVDVEPISSS
ncbi:MAG: polysaccharide deacetylase family protein [Nanoarchaeota archaeon]